MPASGPSPSDQTSEGWPLQKLFLAFWFAQEIALDFFTWLHAAYLYNVKYAWFTCVLAPSLVGLQLL